MYLSRIELDLTRHRTMKALSNPQMFHGAVESAFSGERCRRLWRLDKLNDRLYLLILSEDEPNLSDILAQFGVPNSVSETKNYAPLLDRIAAGSVWRFRLTANPTISKKQNSEGKRGTVTAHCSTKYQKQWLLDRAEKNGFALEEDSFTVTQTHWMRFRKGTEGGRPVTLLSVTYEGLLKVTEPDLFRNALTGGMGRGKAYGQGLLTVMRNV